VEEGKRTGKHAGETGLRRNITSKTRNHGRSFDLHLTERKVKRKLKKKRLKASQKSQRLQKPTRIHH